MIKGENLCKKVIGFDANALYLSCTGKEMGTGYYSFREKKKEYRGETNCWKEAVQWLEYLKASYNLDIRNYANSPHVEKRIKNYSVDGICQSINTICEYYGCYHHGHCGENKDPNKKWKRTKEREKRLGYRIHTITSCQWKINPTSEKVFPVTQTPCTFSDIKDSIMSNL